MELLNISTLKRETLQGKVEAKIHAQIDSILKKETRDQKPYWELTVADAEAKITLRAWSDSPNFSICHDFKKGVFLEVAGEFANNQAFGIDAKTWTCRPLTDDECEALLAGTPEIREKQQEEYNFVFRTVEGLGDPRLRTLCLIFLETYGERFRRAAAARVFHHARRGGLLEHTAQMMRTALVIAGVYPRLNLDLLVAGTLLHDVGKLWENCPPEKGFSISYDERGELIGHITIGIEVVNSLWRNLHVNDSTEWSGLVPASEDVRLHLLHLIAAHHGAKEFGSPVDPKTPEAYALHHIDNLDAKLEMIFTGYETATPLAPRIFDRVRPLPGNLVLPLQKFVNNAENSVEDA